MKNFFTRHHVMRHGLVMVTAVATIIGVGVFLGSTAAAVVGLAFQIWCVLGPAEK